MKPDPNEGLGGSYTVNGRGERELVQRTQDHAEGNRPRDEKGDPLAADGRPVESPPAAAAAPATQDVKASK